MTATAVPLDTLPLHVQARHLRRTEPSLAGADARLCAALAAMRAWGDDHGDRPSCDREALWRGYRIAHELLGAFCAVDASAFGGGR